MGPNENADQMPGPAFPVKSGLRVAGFARAAPCEVADPALSCWLPKTGGDPYSETSEMALRESRDDDSGRDAREKSLMPPPHRL